MKIEKRKRKKEKRFKAKVQRGGNSKKRKKTKRWMKEQSGKVRKGKKESLCTKLILTNCCNGLKCKSHGVSIVPQPLG